MQTATPGRLSGFTHAAIVIGVPLAGAKDVFKYWLVPLKS